jgi:uncharacterized membrane protein
MKLGIFIFGGVVLIATGILQAFLRPRAANETPMQRVINGATVRAVFFTLVGLLAILVGTGTVPIVPMAR